MCKQEIHKGVECTKINWFSLCDTWNCPCGSRIRFWDIFSGYVLLCALAIELINITLQHMNTDHVGSLRTTGIDLPIILCSSSSLKQTILKWALSRRLMVELTPLMEGS